MKKLFLISLIILSGGFRLYSQSGIERVLEEVELNNTRLVALRNFAEAEKLKNKTGIYLQNPELEYHYLPGDPSSLGNRNDISITQGFDFPTAYIYRNQISDLENNQVELDFTRERKNILFETKNLCYNLLHVNAMISELRKRLDHAEKIASAYQSRYNAGDANKIDLNKAKLSQLNIKTKLELGITEKNSLLMELKRMNGGKEIDFADSIFPVAILPPDFENWYNDAENNNPVFEWYAQEIEKSEKQTKLNRSLGLPGFNAGYMNESVVGEQFQGLVVGMTLPLWENKNTVKYAKANSSSVESMKSDYELKYYNNMKSLYSRAQSLQTGVMDYRSKLELYNNTEILGKALEKGEISLIEYLLELSVYYDAVDTVLNMEKELHLILAELYKYE